MDAYWIITAFVVIDTLMEHLGHRSDVRAKVPDSGKLPRGRSCSSLLASSRHTTGRVGA
jgi:hypothetical protein